MEATLHPGDPILLVDDDELVLDSMSALLLEKGFTNVVPCRDSREVKGLLELRSFSCVILDINMPHLSGDDLLPVILQEHPDMLVIVLTGAGEVDIAVHCMKTGAFDYIVKPPEPVRFFASLRHAVEKWEIRGENARLKESLFSRSVKNPDTFTPIVTRSPAMLDIFRYIEAIAPTSLPILITGETGTGKELMARALHAASGRTGAFVGVNVAGLDDALFSDTLFGHRKGAFTGAAADRDGMIGKAAQGTLFLDEIGDLSIESQIRLLRLLQEKEYYPLGSDVSRTTDARFVFATNHDLESASLAGKFRKDLFHRLRSHQIRIPPLRERVTDIPLLADYFLEKTAREIGKKPPRPPRELYALLSAYSFSGNIRELEGVLSDAVVRHESGVLSMQTLKAELEKRNLGGSPAGGKNGEGPEANPFFSLESLPAIQRVTRLLIDEAMRRSGGNQTLAANLLGMSRTTLNKKLKKTK
jgi:DNA-binding NtrC family response regulator